MTKRIHSFNKTRSRWKLIRGSRRELAASTTQEQREDKYYKNHKEKHNDTRENLLGTPKG